MKEEIIWKLVYWDMKMYRNGWFSKSVYVVNLEYGTFRDNSPEKKRKQEKFKTLKLAFDYLENAIEEAERVKL